MSSLSGYKMFTGKKLQYQKVLDQSPFLRMRKNDFPN